MDKTLTVTSELSGAIVLGSRLMLATLNAYELNALAVACDPDGKSDITANYPDADWATVWRETVVPIQQRCAAGELFIDIVDSGEFFVRLTDTFSEEGAIDVIRRHDGWLNVPDGRLQIVEASDLISSLSVLNREPRMQEIEVPSGYNHITVYHQAAPSTEVIAGSYWSANYPAILVRFDSEEARDQNYPPYGITNLTRFEAPKMPLRVTNAIVKRLENDNALLDILISPTIRSGYAVVPMTGKRLSPGEKVRIRLLEKIGGRWRAELIE